MKVKRLQLQNYGRFDELTMKFAPNDEIKGNVTIIVGNNGAGKSQILQALATGFSWFINGLDKAQKKMGNFIDITTIKNNSQQAQVCVSINDFGSEYYYRINTSKDRMPNWTTSNLSEDFSKLALKYIKDYNFHKISNFPILAFYGDNRANWHFDINLNESFTTNILTAYEDSLQADLSYNKFFRWFRDMEDIENENILNKTDILYKKSIQLLRLEEQEIEHKLPMSEGIEKALLHKELGEIKERIYLIESKFDNISKEDDFEENFSLNVVRRAIKYFTGFENPRISRQGTPTMFVEKDGEKLDVNQLSQGEKSLLALIGDIAHRLAILNPSLKNPLEGEGVVLIDEVDLHLHPKWQQNLIDKLTKTFPNVQFILTTHSPHIVSDNPDVLVYILDNGELRPYNNAYGEDANTLLNGVFGVPERTPEIAEKFHKVGDYISNNQLDKAKELIDELASILPKNHTQLLSTQLAWAKAKLAQSKGV